MKRRALLVVLVLAASLHWLLPRGSVVGSPAVAQTAAQASAPNVEERIARVEHGLLPPVLVKGEPTPHMNLVDRMSFHKVPGVSIAVIDQGRIAWARGYGFADTAAKRPVTAETRFQAASISKAVAAAAALHFVEEGKLELDRNVNDYLKSWKVPENDFTHEQKVTLRRILSHSAGLTVHGFPGYEAGKPVPTLVQVLDGAAPAVTEPIRVDIVPGTKWRYAGGGYEVMQQMLIDVLGEPFPEMMQRTVLNKFEMKDSAYSQPLRDDWKPIAATAYRPDGNAVEGQYHTYPELAAAGLWTTPSDLARFAIGIENTLAGKSHDVISKGMAEKMLTRQIENDGLGVFLDGQGSTLRFSHGGGNEGFACLLVAYTETGQGAAIMTNSDSGGELISEIMFAIAHEYGWQDYAPKERSQIKVEPAILRGYVGNYQLAPHFFLRVTMEGDQLVTQATGQPKVPVFPESTRDFFVKEFDVQLTFVPDSQGRATEVIVHQGGQDHHAKRYEGELPQPKEHKEIKVDPKLFDGYVGQYQLAPNFILTITREGDALFAQATGQAKVQIFPESEREFFLKVVDAQITFETNSSDRATSLILHQNGADTPAKRLQ
jgi:CubicO group peptidase (beta-lactamase class C family)